MAYKTKGLKKAAGARIRSPLGTPPRSRSSESPSTKTSVKPKEKIKPPLKKTLPPKSQGAKKVQKGKTIPGRKPAGVRPKPKNVSAVRRPRGAMVQKRGA